ncbi:MAG TPA: heme-binding protein [Planctomycetota bacterium]|nr:heme-binding protein [Planctomycetota bacterium]
MRALPFLILGVAVAIVACSNEGAFQNDANVAQGNTALTQGEVDTILVQAVSQANALGQPAVVAVTDREGEVLGVYVMSVPANTATVGTAVLGEGDIQTAISKAATASAFQSEQDAFTTRTAFFIVQGHYPPNVVNTAGGPLFGVQDSSVPTGDAHLIAYDSSGTPCGIGITGILGGVPLYKNGTPVGGVGVATVAILVTETSPTAPLPSPTLTNGVMKDGDEVIARAGAHGFETPFMIEADNLFVGGIMFPFFGATIPGAANAIATSTSSIPANIGAIDPRYLVRSSPLANEQRVSGQFGVRSTERFLGRVVARASAVFSGTFTNVDRPASVTFNAPLFRYENIPIVSMSLGNFGGSTGEVRTPPIDGVEPPPSQGGLTQADVQTIFAQAAASAQSTLAGIRLPRGSTVRVHVAVVDARGNVLGVYRMGDGTHFSHDIAVQKARTAAFFSSDGSGGVPACAITARAIGFLSQPFFPPGISGNAPGPLVRLRDLVNRGKVTLESPPSLTLINPPPRPPSAGLVDDDVVDPGFQVFDDYGVTPPLELAGVRAAIAETGGILLLADRPDVGFVSPGLQSGVMTFPGAVPLYKNGKLVGAVGTSGDGVDEDDLTSAAGAAGFLPPQGARCDELPDNVVSTVIVARVATIVKAIQSHPDPRIANVYGPIVANLQAQIQLSFQQGLSNVTIPYTKFPRNPGDL